MTLPRVSVVLIAASAVLACGGTSRPAPAVASEQSAPPPPSPASDDKPCPVMANDKCYPSSEAACKAIGCDPAHCQVNYSYPMEASCQ